MNKLYVILLILFFAKATPLVAQYDSYSYDRKFSEGFGFIFKNGLWGYINEEGDVVIEPQYITASPFSDGLAKVMDKKGIVKFIDKENKTIISPGYKLIGNFSEGLCAVNKESWGQTCGYIDKKGSVVIPFKYDNAGDFKHGFAKARAISGNGLINRKGELVIPFLYYEIMPLTKDRIFVFQAQKGAGLVDEKGKEILPISFAEITFDTIGNCFFAAKEYKEEYVTFKKYIVFDKNGKTLLPDTLDDILPFNKKGWAAVRKGKKWGFLNTKFQYEVPFIYDAVAQDFANDFIAVRKDDAYFFMDKNQKRLDSLTFDYVNLNYHCKSCPKNVISVTKNKKYGVISSKDFHPIIPCWYDKPVELPFENKQLICVIKNDKIGYINIKNEVIVPFDYDPYYGYPEIINKLHIYADSKAILYKNEKCGNFDVAQGKILIPFEYKDLSPMDWNGNSVFYKAEKAGLINSKNEVIIQAEYESITLTYNNLYRLYNQRATRLASKDGKKISEYYQEIEATPMGFIVRRNEKYGFVDKNIDEVVPIRYKYGHRIEEELTSYTKIITSFTGFSNGDLIYNIFDSKGKSILPEGHYSDGQMYNNLFLIQSSKGQGFMDTLGNIVIPCIYSGTKPFGKGYIMKKDDFYGVIDAKNNIIHPFIYSHVKRRGENNFLFYNEDLLAHSYRADVLNEDLKFETNFIYDGLEFEDGYYTAKKNGKMGILDEKFKVIIPFEYERIFPNKKNFIAYKNGKAGVVNKENKVLLPFDYDRISPQFYYCIVEKGLKKGLLKDEKLIIPIKYDEFDLDAKNNKNWIKAQKNDKWGFIDEQNQVKIPFNFEKGLKERDDSTFYFQKNSLTGVIDLKGNILLAPEFSYIANYPEKEGVRVQKGQKEGYWRNDGTVYFKGEEFFLKYNIFDGLTKVTMSDSIIAVIKDGKWGFMTETGRIITTPKYQSINTDSEIGKYGCIVKLNGKKGVVNIEGKEVIPTEYDEIILKNSDFPALKKNNKFGFKNLITNNLIDFRYDEVELFVGDFAKVKMNGKWGAIDKKGNLRIPCLYDDVRHTHDNIWIVSLDKKQAIINEKQKILYGFEPVWIDFTPIGIYTFYENDDSHNHYILGPDFKIYSGPHHGVFFYNNAIIIYDGSGNINAPNYKYSLILDANKQIQQVPMAKIDLSDQTPKEEKISFGDYKWTDGAFKTLRSANRLPFQKEGKFGLMNPQGKIIVEPKYEMMGTLVGNMMPVKYKGHFGYIDSMGKTKIEFFLDDAHNFSDGMAIIKKDGNFGAMDQNGKLLIPLKYYELLDFADGVSICKASYKDVFYQFIDQKGNLLGEEYQGKTTNQFKNQNLKPIIADGTTITKKNLSLPSEFGSNTAFSEGKVLVSIQNKFGYINEDGSLAIPFIYEFAYPFHQGIALVYRNNKSYYINQQGKCVLGCGR